MKEGCSLFIALVGIVLVLAIVAGAWYVFQQGQAMFSASENMSLRTQSTTGSEVAVMFNPNYHLNFCGGIFIMFGVLVVGGGILWVLFTKVFPKFG